MGIYGFDNVHIPLEKLKSWVSTASKGIVILFIEY